MESERHGMKRFLDILAYGIVSALILTVTVGLGVCIWQDPAVLGVLGVVASIAWAMWRVICK